MPIDPDFPRNHQVIGKHKHSDGAVDRDVCPVKLYQWYRTDNDIAAIDMANTTSNGDGSTNKEDRLDYTDKSDPIREQDCIYCMACVAVCPTQSIKIDQSNTEFHQQASRTFT